MLYIKIMFWCIDEHRNTKQWYVNYVIKKAFLYFQLKGEMISKKFDNNNHWLKSFC